MPKPIEAARAMRHREGFAFLDSSLPMAGALSILACEPDLTLSGHDWTKLEQELQKRMTAFSDGGGAIGWVGFDGEYHFSFYDRFHAYSHDTKSWKNSPMESVFKAPAPSSLSLDFQPSIKREVFLEMVERA
ncbi:MAG: hypothetical protein EBS96_12960, partial [Spartobacteria bacterium]|nr:hypothetical protein [Spartobacteria bacterium]